jgi:glycosyltransferase involved in cell wall biosynthesis
MAHKKQPGHPVWQWVFWGSLGAMVYTYLLFPLLAILRGLLFPKPYQRNDTFTPGVTIIIPAYNEEKNILAKLDNLRDLDYPREQLEIIVASDGSDDRTNALVAAYTDLDVRLLELPRQGKNAAMNAAVAIASREVLAFSDADTLLPPGVLRLLVAPLCDPTVGGVASDYRYPTSNEGEQGERAYWSFDRTLKVVQSRSWSTSSITGGFYVIRRSLYQTIPSGVLDDLFNMTRVVSAHKRMILEPEAKVYGPIAESSSSEFGRKVRITTRGLRSIWLSRHLLNPLAYGLFAVQFLSHRLLRWLMSIPLVLLTISSPFLWRGGWFYKLATVGLAALHGAAALAMVVPDRLAGVKKLLSFPFYFDMVHVAGFFALRNFLQGQRRDTWNRQ